MPTIALTPVPVTFDLLFFLEQRRLVRTMTPTDRALNTRTKNGTADALYSSPPAYGTHKLICVGKRTTGVKLVCHPYHEEFIVVNPTRRRYKPLYLIVGLHPHQTLAQKARSRTLRPEDVLALELAYNDPRTSVFTMLKGTPHCEVTLPGRGQHPVFFVSEPSRLPGTPVRLSGYDFILNR